MEFYCGRLSRPPGGGVRPIEHQVIFVLVFGGVLYYKYKSKPTPQEAHEKLMRDQAIIMSKIHTHQDERKRAGFSGMTKLPFVDTDYYVGARNNQ